AIVSMSLAILVAPSSCTNNAAATATLSVIADGNWPLYYRWYRNGTNLLSDNDHITGSATSTLVISNVFGADTASYMVTVSNSFGFAPASPPATLTVIDPVITSQLVSRKNHAGTEASFVAVANGTSPTFQWLKNSSAINHATNETLILPAVS